MLEVSGKEICEQRSGDQDTPQLLNTIHGKRYGGGERGKLGAGEVARRLSATDAMTKREEGRGQRRIKLWVGGGGVRMMMIQVN